MTFGKPTRFKKAKISIRSEIASTQTMQAAFSSCVQPVDEKTIWDFFAVKSCEDRQEHRAPNVQGHNTDTNTSLHTRGTRCSWECAAYDGIPPCLGARLSRRLPGETDFYRIDSSDLFASANADARLAQVFALLQKPSPLPLPKENSYQLVLPLPKENSYQLVLPLLVRHLSDHLTPSDAAPECPRVHYRSRARVHIRHGHTCTMCDAKRKRRKPKLNDLVTACQRRWKIAGSTQTSAQSDDAFILQEIRSA